MRKTLAWVLSTVLLVGTLAACGGKEPVPDDVLEGKWSAGIDLADAISANMEVSGMSEVMQVNELAQTLVLEFKRDNTYTLGVDQDALTKSLEGLRDQLKERLTQHLSEAVPGADVDGALAQSGMSIDALVEQALGPGTATGSLSLTGRYRAENGELYMSKDPDQEPADRCFVYTLAGNVLTLDVGGTAFDESVAGLLPLSFERVEEAGR